MDRIKTVTGKTDASNKPARRTIKKTDIIILVIFIIVVAVLVDILLSQVRLKHEVSDARITANRALSDLQKQNATDLHNLGDKTFQSAHSVAELQQLSKNATEFVDGPSTIVKQSVLNAKDGHKIDFVYRFTPHKKPFYIGIVVNKLNGDTSWHLINLSGNSDQSALPQ